MTTAAKREGPGRPPTPAHEALRNIVRVRVTDDQQQALFVLALAGHTAREVLLAGLAALTRRRKGARSG